MSSYRRLFLLVPVVSWPLLAGPAGPPHGDVSEVCQIGFRSGVNTLDEDVWVLFSISSVSKVPAAPGFRFDLNQIEDQRVAPGKRLVPAFTYRDGSCDHRWWFHVRVRFGSPFSAASTKEVQIQRMGDEFSDDYGFPYVTVELGDPACWAADEDGEIYAGEPVVGCEDENEEETSLLRVWNVRSGPVCDAGSAEVGRAPSERTCESRDVPVRGQDICVFDGEETRCTWWGFEFDYENADPDVPVTCVWTRSLAVNDGNYEGIRKRGVATDTVNFKLEGVSGHGFFPGFDNFPENFPHPWYTVDMEYDCSYPGRGRLFVAEYKLIFSNAFE